MFLIFKSLKEKLAQKFLVLKKNVYKTTDCGNCLVALYGCDALNHVDKYLNPIIEGE